MTEKITDASLKLFHSILSGKGLQHIVDVGAELLGNPLMVYDPSYKILAYSKSVTSDDPYWLDMTKRGFGSYDFFKMIKDIEGFKKIADSDQPVLVEYDFVDYKSLTFKITINGKRVGYASTISTRQPFQEGDTELIELFCKTAATEMHKDSFVKQTKGIMYEYFLSELLNGQIADREAIEERQKYIDLTPGKNLYILTMRNTASTVENNSLPYLRDILETRVPGKCILYNNQIVMLLSHNKPQPVSEYYQIILEEFLKDNDMVAGISRCFHNLSEIRKYYQQSVAAIGLGLRLHKQAAIFNYDDYALYHLLDAAAEQKDLKEFCHPSLFRLMEYDSKNHTNFTQSLCVYLTNGSDLSKSAQFFNIHRNSMDYRINKIEEILGIDLSDADLSFSFYISFKILFFVEGRDFLLKT